MTIVGSNPFVPSRAAKPPVAYPRVKVKDSYETTRDVVVALVSIGIVGTAAFFVWSWFTFI